MNNSITVKDLARQYNVSEQAIRQFCKKHNIRKEIVRTKQGKRETYCFDEEALKLIGNHYTNESQATQGNATSKRKESNTTQLLIDSLQEQISTLKAQLDIKDKQISELNKQISDLNAERIELNAERKAERLERQTILARFLKSEDKPEIETTLTPAEQSPAPSAPKQTAQDNAQSKPRSTQRREPTARKTPKKGIFTTLFNRKGR